MWLLLGLLTKSCELLRTTQRDCPVIVARQTSENAARTFWDWDTGKRLSHQANHRARDQSEKNAMGGHRVRVKVQAGSQLF